MHSAKDDMKKQPKAKNGADTPRPGRNVGDALRQAYDEAVGEAIPDDLLDLLKKLD
ncbi:NepR family anti-sigma factor [Sphingomonas sp. CJ20]